MEDNSAKVGKDTTQTEEKNSSTQPGGKPVANASLKRKQQQDHEPSKTPRIEHSPDAEPHQKPSDDPAEQDQEVEEPSEQESSDAEEAPEDNAPPTWRAVLSFHDMIKDPSSAGPIYAQLDPEQKLIIALGVRNLFLATSKSDSVRDTDRQILDNMKGVLVEDDNPAVVGESGLKVSFYPSRTYSKLKYIQDLDQKIGEHPHRSYFAQLEKSPRVFAAFVESGV